MIGNGRAQLVWSKAAWVVLLASATHARAVVLAEGHVDLAISYMGGGWEWLVRDEDFNEFPLTGVSFTVGQNAAATAPEDAAFNPILGAPGSPVWVIPQSPQPGKLFLGFDGSGTGANVFVENRITLALHSVDGPGEFALYSVNGFGVPFAAMNTRDGIDAGADRFQLNSAAGHVHFAWAFSAPGEYRIEVAASGTLVAGGTVMSSPAEWRFHVVPEPAGCALFAVGAAFVATRRRRDRFRPLPIGPSLGQTHEVPR
jgi:surface-anchored protein